MRLILTTDSGEVLDSIPVTSEEWREASRLAFPAVELLQRLQPGDLPQEAPAAESCPELVEAVVIPLGEGEGPSRLMCQAHAREAFRRGGVNLRGPSSGQALRDCGDLA